MSKSINIRISDELKESADILFKDIGISLSDAVRVFIKKSVNCGGIPFALTLNSPNKLSQQALDDSNQRKTLKANSVNDLLDG